MSEISLQDIRILREDAACEAERLREQLQTLQSQLIEQQARVDIYTELLNGGSRTGREHSANVEMFQKGAKQRAPRSTKVEMQRRKDIVASIFVSRGDLQPRELLPLVQNALGYPLETHHLRAVLTRFHAAFIQRSHGVWGLTHEALNTYAPHGVVATE